MASEDSSKMASDAVAEAATGSVADIFTTSNFILFAALIYLLYKLFVRKAEKEEEVYVVPEPLPHQDMTLEELRVYDGNGPDKRVCIAVLGRVYDVSKGYTFYGPGGAYHTFAGHDATRALAKFDVSAVKNEWDDVSDLTQSEMSSVKEWQEQFDERYHYVGDLVKSEQDKIDKAELDDSTKSTESKDDSTKQ